MANLQHETGHLIFAVRFRAKVAKRICILCVQESNRETRAEKEVKKRVFIWEFEDFARDGGKRGAEGFLTAKKLLSLRNHLFS